MAAINPHDSLSSALLYPGLMFKQRGFIMLTVVMTLTVLAALTFMLSRQSAINAGSAVREQQSDAARYIAQAGLNHALWQANGASCTGYTNLTDIPLGAHRYSTSIAPTSGSPVSIKVTGMHAQGASYSIQRDRVKAYQNPSTLVLQPDAGAGKDTYPFAFKPSQNYGTTTTVQVGDAGQIRYSLLQFDLSGIPLEAQITNADLSLYLESVFVAPAGSFVTAYRMLVPWTEAGATYNTSDGSVTWTWPNNYDLANPVAPQPFGSAAIAWRSWDVTPLIPGWVNNPTSNYGLVLVASGGINNAQFSSSDSTNTTLRPKLTITYTCECGIICGAAPPKTGYYRDEFALPVCNSAVDYSRSVGTLDWMPTAWIEVGETGGVTDACSGSIKIQNDGIASNYSPRFTASGTALKRTANLTGFTSAWLSFDYRRVMDSASDRVEVAVSPNGGTSWTVLDAFIGVATDAVYQQKSYDISAYISANTVISINAVNFATTGGGAHQFFVDNVQIGDPPIPKPQGYFDHFKNKNCAAADYFGSDGTLDWSADGWTENTETDGSCNGFLQITTDPNVPDTKTNSYRLLLDQRGHQIDRQVDLSGFTAAYLSLDFRQYNYPTTSDYFRIRISKDGGTSWSVLEQFNGIVSDTEYRSVSYDISAYRAANTIIRFEVAGVSNIQKLYIDNVLISETPGGGLPPPSGTTVTLNPAGDNYLQNGSSSNFGAGTALLVGKTTGAGNALHSVLQFATGSIPTGAFINSATLRVNLNFRFGSAGFNLNAHKITQSWTETGSNWSKATTTTNWTSGGGTYTSTVIDSIAADPTGWYEWNVKPLVQEWVDYPANNQGVILVPSTSVSKSNYLNFFSREDVNKPQLVIDFTAP